MQYKYVSQKCHHNMEDGAEDLLGVGILFSYILLLPAPCLWIPKWKANQLTTHQFLIIPVSSLSFPIQLADQW